MIFYMVSVFDLSAILFDIWCELGSNFFFLRVLRGCNVIYLINLPFFTDSKHYIYDKIITFIDNVVLVSVYELFILPN